MPNNVIEIVLRAVDEATEPLKGVSKAFQGLKGVLGGAVLGLGLKELVDVISDAQKGSFELENAIKAVGGAAGTTLADMTELAESIQKTTTFSSDAAKSAEALGLRLGLTGDTVSRLVKDSADLAAATGGDLVGAMEKLAAAVADPERGMLSLRRSGIILTQQQQYLIQQLAKFGEGAKASNIILSEVERRYKDAGDAAKNTLGGALDSLTNSFKSLFEVSADGSSAVIEAINATSKSLSDLNDALHGALKPTQELSAGTKLLATTLLTVETVISGIATTISTALTVAFESVGKLIGGIAASITAAVQGNFAQAGSIIKDMFVDIGKSAYKTISDGGQSIIDETSDTIEKVVKLWDSGSRDIAQAADISGRKSISAPSGLSKEQLAAIDSAYNDLIAKAGQLKTQATAPLQDMAAAMEEFGVKVALSRLHIVGLNDDVSKLPKKIRDALDEFRKQNANAAQRVVLTSLQDQTAELDLQSTLHGKALDDAVEFLHIQQSLRDTGGQITDEIKRQQELKKSSSDSAVLSDLRDQLTLAKMTDDEREREINLRKLSASATETQKVATVALTDQIRHAQTVTETYNAVIGDIKNAFANMLETGQFSVKSLTKTILIELAKREIFEAIDKIGQALRAAFSQGSSGGGGIVGGIAGALGSFFGFAAGGHPSGLALVGENGPELANFGSGGQVWNKSELASAGMGAANVNYSPQYNVSFVSDNTEQSEKKLMNYFNILSQKQQSDLIRKLGDNGIRIR